VLDRGIPFCNIILKCSKYSYREVILPEGFRIVPFENGFERAWAGMEFAVGDFHSEKAAAEYFNTVYMCDLNHSREKMRFLLNEKRQVIGSCIAWQDIRNDIPVSSLHWLIVDEKYQGQKLGRALCNDTMRIFQQDNGFPVYIHTQPWSWKAILLYLSCGFKIQRTDTFSNYVNEYDKAMKVLKRIMDDKQYHLLSEASEN